ncbi:TetR/AcrR family transcriptional regulator [Filobacillus milosensis]|uniref:TetR/AcrR family transcriptional regulator n=1 Tax=Filobacillus milosensis TaxID=94137 RepID=A0A4Y8IE77_9BACI|nr:TetR/AcrR family transcriptional regulator [Filobacillus milosensis]TFB14236.1 TetR/AcrR family transcriptional regulator [Filobacillus milosensis]
MARQRKFTEHELFLTTKSLLLEHGYEAFTFSQLAEELNVSRGTIYKYFENKEDLATEYMLYEMNMFLKDLEHIHNYETFSEQLDYLLDLIFKNADIQHLIEMGQHIPIHQSDRAKKNHEKLEQLHIEMYRELDEFIQLGKRKKKIRQHIPDSLVLGYIFQSIAIPNHFGIPHEEWVASIKDIIKNGMFEDIN